MHFYKYSAVSIFQKSNLFNVLYSHFYQIKLAARTIPAAKIIQFYEFYERIAPSTDKISPVT